MNYPIETGIPIPAVNTAPSNPANRTNKPWRTLRPGQSFFIAGGKASTIGPQITRWSSLVGSVFVYRTTIRSPEDPTIGIRVWRINRPA